MSQIGEIVARLIAAGTPPELAAVAVAEAFQAGASIGKSADSPVDETAARRRAYDRDRARAKREILRQSADNPPKSESALSSSVSTDSELEEKKEKKERGRGKILPADWRPSEGHYQQGIELGMSRAQVGGFAEDLRLWARANEHRQVAKKSNWDLAFSAWLRRSRADQKGRGPPKNRNGFLDLALEMESTSDERGHSDSQKIPIHGTEH